MLYNLDHQELFDFVRTQQIVLESAKGLPVPSMVQKIVGVDFVGGWWALPNSSTIYNALQALRHRKEILVCRLVNGKVTLVHEDSLLALVSLQSKLPPGALDQFEERHGDDGRHQLSQTPVAAWWKASHSNAGRLLDEPDALLYLDEVKPGLAKIVQKFYRAT